MSTFLRECLVQALPAAKKAGEAILEVYRGDIDVSYKADQSPLTQADERAHRIIADALSQANSLRIPILSEEGKDTPYETRKQWAYFWLVDPLDGTKEFIQRRGEFTVNIALIHKHRPVAGVLCVPVKGRVYFAADGIGSHRIDDWEMIPALLGDKGPSPGNVTSLEALVDAAAPLPVVKDNARSPAKLTVVGSRSHATEKLENFVEKARQTYEEVTFISAGSALKFGLVAEGTADIYPRFGPTMEWDTGAGHCVVEQSGGAVLRLKDKAPLVYNKRDLLNPGFVCSSRHLGSAEDLL